MNDLLGDRMKKYETAQRTFHTPKTPLFVRVDGKAFHTLTKNRKRPFDNTFIRAMHYAANEVKDMLAGYCVAVYVQSDEATFMLQDWENFNTEPYFDGNQQKLCSIIASAMTYHFSDEYGQMGLFDARSFNVPQHDVVNNFLWRMKDWYRNSINMIGQSLFTHKQLHGKSVANVITMIEELKGVGWLESTFTGQERWGSFWTPNLGWVNLKFTYNMLHSAIWPTIQKLYE